MANQLTERASQVNELAAYGLSEAQIALQLGISRQRINQLKQRYGIKIKPAESQVEAEAKRLIPEIRRLMESGLSQPKVRDKLNISWGVLKKAIEIGNIKPLRHSEDLAGKTFGLWTVLKFHGCTPYGGEYEWLCRCGGCGEEKPVRRANLTRGLSTRCKKCAAKARGGTKVRRVDTGEEFVSIEAAARQVGISRATLYRRICDGKTIVGTRWEVF
ncbi:hypothetical protein [Leptolyngbya sp. FACHB-261]|uniref:hypothetical protein n=1 Tax=Leptolyngbya sp. FACHB-261 TaxID=2692806 RepID=UPI00168822FC|nr:hypothetical protein [Leptolyngbya sp. FACHB-261]MBD2100186.1 hypothetical protein [Leptolyngbya sp. FACHB-261]